LNLIVITVSGMVANKLKEPISAVLQNRKLRRGESDNPTPMILSVLSQVYITLNHYEQSKIYLSSREVFIHKMLRAIWFFYWTTCQIRSACRLFGSWDWGVLPTIVAESVFNPLEIVASWFELRKGCGVNPQPTLDRGATSVLCGSWDWDVFSTIIAKSVFNRLDIVESWDFLHGRCKLLSRSLTDLISTFNPPWSLCSYGKSLSRSVGYDSLGKS
jgi:hypothetical protein